jgi:hypothetical protein
MEKTMRFKGASLLWAAALCATPGLLLPSSLALAADLIINEVSAKNQDCVIVHEIPDDAVKADAVKFIERIRDMFWRGREIIDATKVDDSTLKEKLKKGFTLYTTMGAASKLFKATTGRLGIRIEGNTLTWNGVSAPVSELRIIAVGKNPYGEGNCVVYAAGSSKLLGGINACFHGPCSYHIYQGDKLLKEGLYKDDFSPSSGRLTRTEAEADVHQFFSTLQHVHPDLLAKVTLEDYIKLKKQTEQDVAKRLDGKGTISINDLAYVLYYAAAYFGDGHTSVQWWRLHPNESSTPGVRFPPFLLGYDNGRFVIAASSDKALVGMEILSVDGKPIRKFLRPILDRCSGETIVFKAARFTSNQAFWYSLCRLCGSASSLALKTRDARGAEREHPVKTVGFADFEKLAANTPSNKREELQRQGTHVAFLDSDRIAHFVYPQFTLNDGEKKKVDGIFAEIKAKKASELVIDLRGNGGGNSSMGDFIFSYLYAEKFTSFSKIRMRLSREVLTSCSKNQQSLEVADLEGLTATCSGGEEKMAKPSAFFSGRVFLLVDNGTFSSAAVFTAMFRDYAVGTIVGYETGGLPVCFGDIYQFSLTNSGISCGVSYKQFFGPRPRPGDDEHGVIPNIPMSDKLLQPYQNDEDPVLAFTLDHVKKTRPR